MNKSKSLLALRAMFLTTAILAAFLLLFHPGSAAALAAPSGLSLSKSTGTGTSTNITLSWTDNSPGEACFKVERNTGSGFVQIATTTLGATTTTDANLNASTYSYRIRAFFCGTDTAYSNTATTTIVPTPLSYWKLDGNSNDAVGSNNGTDSNMAYATSSGVVNQGASFDGTARKIDIGHMLTGTENVSVAAWVKTSSTATEKFIWSQRQEPNPMPSQAIFWLINGVPTFFEQSSGAGTSGAISANTAVNDGNWHFIGVSQNGNAYTFYLDGVQDGTVTSGTPANFDSSRTGTIGYDRVDLYYGTDPHYFGGPIDEVGVWNTALSSDDFATLYNSGAGLQYPFH